MFGEPTQAWSFDDALVIEDACELGVGGGKVHEAECQFYECWGAARLVDRVLHIIEMLLQPLEQTVDGGTPQRFFRSEVVVDQWLGYADPPGDRGSGCAFVALLGELGLRGLEYQPGVPLVDPGMRSGQRRSMGCYGSD